MGRKFVRFWGGRYRRGLSERLFQSKEFNETALTFFVEGIYVTHPHDNERGLRRLIKDVKQGDLASTRLLELPDVGCEDISRWTKTHCNF